MRKCRERNGCEMKALSEKNCQQSDRMDVLNLSELQKHRTSCWLGGSIRYLETIDSTNAEAARLAEQGFGHGTLVVADHQQTGRGRRGRSWESPAGTAIYLSFLLKPKIHPNHAAMLTLVAALAVSRAIVQLTGKTAGIKWPNDIVMNGKKVCGILTEMSMKGNGIDYIVVGIGINANITQFDEALAGMATSLQLETGRQIKRAALIGAVCAQFEKLYEIYLETQDLQQLAQEYNEKLVNRNQSVKVLDPNDSFEGQAVGITAQGELIVDTLEGRKYISSGEVSVRGIYGYV